MKITFAGLFWACIFLFLPAAGAFSSKSGSSPALGHGSPGLPKMAAQKAPHPLRFVDVFEGGTKYLSPNGIYPVLNLYGGWHAMGRQYGFLLRHRLRQFHDDISADVAARGISRKEQVETATAISLVYGPQIHQGSSQAPGMTPEQKMPHPCCSGCSLPPAP